VAELLSHVGPEFKPKHAIRALKEANGDIEGAVAWLLERDSSSSSSSDGENEPHGPIQTPGKERDDPSTEIEASTSAIPSKSETHDHPADEMTSVKDGCQDSIAAAKIDGKHGGKRLEPNHRVPPSHSSTPSAIGILLGAVYNPAGTTPSKQREIYWTTSQNCNRVCGDRLKSLLPELNAAFSRFSITPTDTEIQPFEFSSPSPDDEFSASRAARLDKAKLRNKPLRKRGKQPSAPPQRQRERSVEREVREEIERDRAHELEMIGIYDDADLGGGRRDDGTLKTGGATGLSGRGEARDEQKRKEGMRSRKKNRNSKMNRRKKTF